MPVWPCVVAVLCGLLSTASSLACYECSSLTGQCNDRSDGAAITTANLYACDGGQCAKVVTENSKGEKETRRFCYEFRKHDDICERSEDEELATVTTRCYCSEDKCNGATSLPHGRSLQWLMVMLVTVYLATTACRN